MLRTNPLACCWIVLLVGVAVTTGRMARASEAIDFNQDIRPILSENCFHCHGPDADARDAGLRLDTLAGATADLGGYQALVPGDSDASEIYRRITTAEEDERMPPPESKRQLSPQDRELIRRWIQAGAQYVQHWSFEPPVRPAIPALDGSPAEVQSPIDAFVLRRLQREQLGFSSAAAPRILARRVCLDLVGIPPTPEQVTEFVKEFQQDPDAAYETLVDRLLSSDRFGERWARPWLDLARYADSNGFQADQLRDSWAYRDWVIDAVNANIPFDQFTIEQLAGDLLPDATLSQKIATGFHRTVTCNVEAGVHPEENRTNQVLDRVNTTATVWLGVTMECVQCHDHKYDPFTMEDYYSLFACFNNTLLEVELPSGTNDVSHDFIGPFIDLPQTPARLQRRQDLEEEIASVKEERRAAVETAEEKRIANLAARESKLEKQLAKLKPARTLIMVELDQPRETFVLKRGNYLAPGTPVSSRTPRSLHAMAPGQPANRLGLARWLVSRDNPLVARVTVNRWWAELFGHGIVATLEDFGTQCEPPTHPDLLDWLAVEFMESRWDRKHVLKTIVMSTTYRQDSRVTSELYQQDPDNRLYARAPRFRLNAERIRDNGLAVSGLLSTKMGGPPVMPYQPPGIWRQVGRNEPKWIEAKSEDRWRRGIYIVYRRAAPYPSMVNFDAPDRGACTVKRPRTNTPLQALTLLNDPAYVEMALALADRVLVESPTSNRATRLDRAFLTVLARKPTLAEGRYLADVLQQRLHQFRSDVVAADALVSAAAGGYKPHHGDRAELAAWFTVASILLNLDETITKG